MERNKKIYDSILDLIGQTPIVRLNKICEGFKAEIYAKLEFFNPTGSVKDRTACYMVNKALAEGRVTPGNTIIENSSGNMALGLALVAIQLGFQLRVVVRDRISREKMDMLKAMGVELIKVDSSLPPEHPDSYNNITPRLAIEIPGCYFPDQHNNRENNEAHYSTTGPEIWEQMEGGIDYFVAGMGTGGTIGGVGKFLKEKNPRIIVVGVDPVGSVFYDYFYSGIRPKPSPYLIEGLGDEFIVGCADFDNIDRIIKVSDKDAFLTCRELVKKEGILAGGSSGAALWAALKIAREIDRPARIVTIFPDSAFRYLSTIFNDDWMKEKGFL
ncbi:MAG: cysteine synthase family protein [Candidatus Saccharicenans sp.]|nr:cysteine synthase family protein [Candidatus Saccharicenans sp.]